MNTRKMSEEEIKYTKNVLNEIYKTEETFNKTMVCFCKVMRDSLNFPNVTLSDTEKNTIQGFLDTYEKLKQPILDFSLKEVDQRFDDLKSVFGNEKGMSKCGPLGEAIEIDQNNTFMMFLAEQKKNNNVWHQQFISGLGAESTAYKNANPDVSNFPGKEPSAYVTASMQRATRYPMLLEDAAKHSPALNSELQQMKGNIVEFNSDINQKILNKGLLNNILEYLEKKSEPKDIDERAKLSAAIAIIKPISTDNSEKDILINIIKAIYELKSKLKDDLREIMIKEMAGPIASKDDMKACKKTFKEYEMQAVCELRGKQFKPKMPKDKLKEKSSAEKDVAAINEAKNEKKDEKKEEKKVRFNL